MRDAVRLPGLLAPALLWLGGCAAAPIRAWETSLERYVADQGNGDPNVLRAMDRDPAESDFNKIGAAKGGVPFFSPTRTDANGILVGRREVGGRGWYVFLVGTVQYRGEFLDFPLDDPRLTDLRLVAFSGEPGKFDWITSPRDDEALALYTRPQLEHYRESHPDRADATEGPAIFPTPADVLKLTAEAPVIAVTDEHSGARWVAEIEP